MHCVNTSLEEDLHSSQDSTKFLWPRSSIFLNDYFKVSLLLWKLKAQQCPPSQKRTLTFYSVWTRIHQLPDTKLIHLTDAYSQPTVSHAFGT